MLLPSLTPPARRADLVIRPFGDDGRYVVKDLAMGAYFHLGSDECFLLEQLDGKQDAAAICAAFAQKSGQPLATEELDEFVELARRQGLLQSNGERQSPGGGGAMPSPNEPGSDARRSPRRQSLLYWRKNIFDPDRLFTWLEPKVRLFWTRAFLFASAACIALAAAILWTGRADAVHSFTVALRWETLLLAWLTLLAVTTLHESAHGLTCKHYGGEVHEIGFLLMYFMPCFYCNVSDAWLFREKSKRLWVTLAGGYFELFLWALAGFVWRVTVPDTLVNYLAFVVLSVCGVRSLFNFNPLLKLDGYYLLSDALEIPNLRRRSFERFQAHARHLLWGGARPPAEPRGRLLTGFGIVSWSFSVFFLCGMCLAMFRWASHSVWGVAGMIAVGLLAAASLRGLFSGFLNGEVKAMLRSRHLRTAAWVGIIALLISGMFLIEIEDRAAGPFTLRAKKRAEVQAPVAGFLRQAYADEGDRVAAGMLLFRLEVPELAARLAGARAARETAAAQLALLEVGARPEEVAAQRERVARAAAARNMAAGHLDRSSAAHAAESERRAQQIVLAQAELKASASALTRATELRSKNAISASDFDTAQAEHDVCRAKVQQAIADLRAHEAAGVLKAEEELATRERDWAEVCAVLGLMEAGTRPEELAAQQARVQQLEADIAELEAIVRKQTIVAPRSGVVVTPHVADRIGQ